jgi:DNA-binding IclR family transcriptional regulator
MPRDYSIEAVAKALDVLKELSNAPHYGLTVADLVKRTELPRDFVRRALLTLEAKGFARQWRKDGWKLGPEALGLSDRLLDRAIRTDKN